jgi:hypothetical protein
MQEQENCLVGSAVARQNDLVIGLIVHAVETGADLDLIDRSLPFRAEQGRMRPCGYIKGGDTISIDWITWLHSFQLYRALQMNAHMAVRPEGPIVARPGRQAGIGLRSDRALKARHHWLGTCRTFGAQFRHILYPGLTAGAALRASNDMRIYLGRSV